MGAFVEEFPNRFIECGIAEQNSVLMAAGLATTGKTVFVAAYGVFLSMRALEQLRTFVAYPNLNVKFAAGLGGLFGDRSGASHQATEDISIIRSIPNLTLLSAADSVAAEKFVKLMAQKKGPVYLRIGRGKSPVIYNESDEFEIGKAVRLLDYGNDIAIVSTGRCLAEAITAIEQLNQDGIRGKVIDMHTIKPIDRECLIQVAQETGIIFTVEDGSINGGLGSAVAEIIVEEGLTHKGKPVVVKKLGLDDSFACSGTLEELFDLYDLSSSSIKKRVKKYLQTK